MRTGPGGPGRSSFRRVSVLWRRIAGTLDARERRARPVRGLLATEPDENRPQRGATVVTGERHTKCPQVTADRLQLAEDRAGRAGIERVADRRRELEEAGKRQVARHRRDATP